MSGQGHFFVPCRCQHRALILAGGACDTMRPVRPKPVLLSAAAACAVVHAAGILFADPLWRYAEVLCVGVLLVYAVMSGLPAPRWAVPAALAALAVDAVRTMPANPGTEAYTWQVLQPGNGIDVPSGFEAGLTATGALLAAAALLLVVWGRGGWRRGAMAAAALPAVLITGYALVRVVDIGLAVRAEGERYAIGIDAADAVTAVSLAVLPALTLALMALALAAALAGHGRRLASTGAALLAVAALPHLDSSIDAVQLPLYAGERTALFSSYAIAPTLTMPSPVPAMTAAVELTAVLLLIAGSTGRRRRADPLPTAE